MDIPAAAVIGRSTAEDRPLRRVELEIGPDIAGDGNSCENSGDRYDERARTGDSSPASPALKTAGVGGVEAETSGGELTAWLRAAEGAPMTTDVIAGDELATKLPEET